MSPRALGTEKYLAVAGVMAEGRHDLPLHQRRASTHVRTASRDGRKDMRQSRRSSGSPPRRGLPLAPRGMTPIRHSLEQAAGVKAAEADEISATPEMSRPARGRESERELPLTALSPRRCACRLQLASDEDG
jgi:hypothetical protein